MKTHQSSSERSGIDDYIQTTGYFRCKQCNSAGNWELPTDLSLKITANLLMSMGNVEPNDLEFGEIAIYDGTSTIL